MVENLIIFQKVYDLILYSYPIINKFPKSQRFVLGQQIENYLLEVLVALVKVNQTKDKSESLKQVSVNLDVVRFLIRLSKDLHFISVKHYCVFAEKINEVGKMLSGLMVRFS
jgi:hypothetical protein